jgi:murein L,D-transpeptidase YafK
LKWIREHYLEPTAFIGAHRKLLVPQDEPRLVLVHPQDYRMRTYEQNRQTGEFAVSLGQGQGRKRRRGDLKTPLGMYFVVDRHRGEFGGEYGEYYGGYWIKINYPNPHDAAWGREQGLITATQQRRIGEAWRKRELTLGNTRLGGGIGFHGWIEEWSNDGPRHLSWGCVVMHLGDIARVYDTLPLGTMVVIF